MTVRTTCSLPAPLPASQITEEQRLKAELEAQVEALRARIAEQRVQMGGVNNSAEQAIKVRRAGESSRPQHRQLGLPQRCLGWLHLKQV